MPRYDLDGPKGGPILRNVTWATLQAKLAGYVKRFGSVRIRTRKPAPPPPPTPKPPPRPQYTMPGVFRLNGGFLSDNAQNTYTPDRYGYVRNLGVRAIYVKVHHRTDRYFVSKQWVEGWQALGVAVIGWGWLEGDPTEEAKVAAACVKDYGLNGYIGNAEFAYEGRENFWKSSAFCAAFRLLSNTSLGVSFLGYGSPYRFFDWKPWIAAGAALLPQSYNDKTALSPAETIAMCDRAELPRELLNVSLGVSMPNGAYPPNQAQAELGPLPWNVWVLESTNDDYLRALED